MTFAIEREIAKEEAKRELRKKLNNETNKSKNNYVNENHEFLNFADLNFGKGFEGEEERVEDDKPHLIREIIINKLDFDLIFFDKNNINNQNNENKTNNIIIITGNEYFSNGEILLEIDGKKIDGMIEEDIKEEIKNKLEIKKQITIKIQSKPNLVELKNKLKTNENYLDNKKTENKSEKRKTNEKFDEEKKEMVWIQHKNGMSEAVVMETYKDDKEVKVRLIKRNLEFRVSQSQVDKANPPAYSHIENLSLLNHINQSTCVHSLSQRFHSNLIHTFAGSSIITIRPFHPLRIYSQEIMKLFKSSLSTSPSSFYDVIPHIYFTGQSAYEKMISHYLIKESFNISNNYAEKRNPEKQVFNNNHHNIYKNVFSNYNNNNNNNNNDNNNQAIILMGPSGGGKTTNLWHLLHFYTLYSKKDDQVITAQKLKATLFILNSFLNASTIYNNDASRALLTTELKFNSQNHLNKILFQLKFLDGQRMMRRKMGEKCFHGFYYLMGGASPELRQLLKLKSSSIKSPNLFFTSDSKDSKYNQDSWNYLIECFDELKINKQEVMVVMIIMSVIFHLGSAGIDLKSNEPEIYHSSEKERIKNNQNKDVKKWEQENNDENKNIYSIPTLSDLMPNNSQLLPTYDSSNRSLPLFLQNFETLKLKFCRSCCSVTSSQLLGCSLEELSDLVFNNNNNNNNNHIGINNIEQEKNNNLNNEKQDFNFEEKEKKKSFDNDNLECLLEFVDCLYEILCSFLISLINRFFNQTKNYNNNNNKSDNIDRSILIVDHPGFQGYLNSNNIESLKTNILNNDKESNSMNNKINNSNIKKSNHYNNHGFNDLCYNYINDKLNLFCYDYLITKTIHQQEQQLGVLFPKNLDNTCQRKLLSQNIKVTEKYFITGFPDSDSSSSSFNKLKFLHSFNCFPVDYNHHELIKINSDINNHITNNATTTTTTNNNINNTNNQKSIFQKLKNIFENSSNTFLCLLIPTIKSLESTYSSNSNFSSNSVSLSTLPDQTPVIRETNNLINKLKRRDCHFVFCFSPGSPSNSSSFYSSFKINETKNTTEVTNYNKNNNFSDIAKVTFQGENSPNQENIQKSEEFSKINQQNFKSTENILNNEFQNISTTYKTSTPPSLDFPLLRFQLLSTCLLQAASIYKLTDYNPYTFVQFKNKFKFLGLKMNLNIHNKNPYQFTKELLERLEAAKNLYQIGKTMIFLKHSLYVEINKKEKFFFNQWLTSFQSLCRLNLTKTKCDWLRKNEFTNEENDCTEKNCYRNKIFKNYKFPRERENKIEIKENYLNEGKNEKYIKNSVEKENEQNNIVEQLSNEVKKTKELYVEMLKEEKNKKLKEEEEKEKTEEIKLTEKYLRLLKENSRHSNQDNRREENINFLEEKLFELQKQFDLTRKTLNDTEYELEHEKHERKQLELKLKSFSSGKIQIDDMKKENFDLKILETKLKKKLKEETKKIDGLQKQLSDSEKEKFEIKLKIKREEIERKESECQKKFIKHEHFETIESLKEITKENENLKSINEEQERFIRELGLKIKKLKKQKRITNSRMEKITQMMKLEDDRSKDSKYLHKLIQILKRSLEEAKEDGEAARLMKELLSKEVTILQEQLEKMQQDKEENLFHYKKMLLEKGKCEEALEEKEEEMRGVMEKFDKLVQQNSQELKKMQEQSKIIEKLNMKLSDEQNKLKSVQFKYENLLASGVRSQGSGTLEVKVEELKVALETENVSKKKTEVQLNQIKNNLNREKIENEKLKKELEKSEEKKKEKEDKLKTQRSRSLCLESRVQDLEIFIGQLRRQIDNQAMECRRHINEINFLKKRLSNIHLHYMEETEEEQEDNEEDTDDEIYDKVLDHIDSDKKLVFSPKKSLLSSSEA